jgi:signal transduction histidine kinase
MNSTAPQSSAVPRWTRSLLPGAMLDDGDTTGDGNTRVAPPRSLRDWVVDVIVITVSIGFGGLVLGMTWRHHATPIAILDLVGGLIACLALWVRRSRPLGVTLLAVLLSSFSAMSAGAALVAIFNLAVYRGLRTLAAVTAVSLVSSLIYSALYQAHGGYDWSGLAIGALLTGVAIGWGSFARARRLLVLSLRDRARQLEAERRLHVEQARMAERARIAREMHDVLAHRISLLSVHAGALEFRPGAPPEEIARAAGVIRASAHAALEELRDVIGLLRDTDGNVESGPERPQPTLGQVPELIEESREAGMHIRLTLALDEPGAVPDATGRTVYRIVQEGLTNARKHAPASQVEVAITRHGDETMEVSVLSAPSVGAATTFADATSLPGAGTGLIGLAERVSLAGGRLEHGPTPNGGYLLHATLPQPR